MALTPGARLGPYEIVAPIGAGAMGEVYRARDTRLGRDVAVKVLTRAVAGDADRLNRFEQEARAAAALNHPNILAVFDIGHDAGSPYVVSELLEGETLRERLKAGALPVRKAVEFAVQLAHGLAAAHEKGIVHRDLKPDNIFLTSSGLVKILDFGLAKLTEAKPIGGVGSMVPTTAPGTEPGMLLGTLGYMSPEQVRGIPADHRSDIFSFGAIFYEMLSGHAAFQRDTPADTMSAILKEQPADIGVKDRHIPPLVVRIVERCLEKAPAMRFQSTEDLAFALVSARSDSDVRMPDAAALEARTHKRARWIWAGAAAAAIIALAAVASLLWLRKPVDEGFPVKLSVAAPPGVVQTNPLIRVSPDGTRLLFAATTSDGARRLWIRSLNSLDASPIGETEGATNPFWSADSRSVGYFSGGQLRTIELAGGSATTLCAAPQASGGTWNADGVIVFSAEGQLRRVSATGGTPALLNGPNGKRDGSTLAYPAFLPDGQHFLYLDTGHGGIGEAAVYAAALDSSERTQVLSAARSNAWYSQGYLLFLRNTTLVAQPFDVRRLALSGNAIPIAEDIQRSAGGAPSGAFSVSDRVLAYRTGIGARGFPTELQWFSRTGKPLGTIGERADYSDVEISRDGSRAAVSVLDPGTGRDIWIFDLARGIPTRFTTDPADEAAAAWSPDGSQIIFSSRRKGHFDFYQKASSGIGGEQELLADNREKFPSSWSPDGRVLIYNAGNLAMVGSNQDLLALPLTGDRKPYPVLATPFNEWHGRLSPDGHWLVYESTESGQNEIYVTSFPSLSGKWRVSTSGGNWPRWRRDGKEVLFLVDSLKLMAADVTVVTGGREATLTVGAEHMLFQARWPPAALAPYDLAPDGRILAATLIEPPTSSPITLVVDWLADLKK